MFDMYNFIMKPCQYLAWDYHVLGWVHPRLCAWMYNVLLASQVM